MIIVFIVVIFRCHLLCGVTALVRCERSGRTGPHPLKHVKKWPSLSKILLYFFILAPSTVTVPLPKMMTFFLEITFLGPKKIRTQKSNPLFFLHWAPLLLGHQCLCVTFQQNLQWILKKFVNYCCVGRLTCGHRITNSYCFFVYAQKNFRLLYRSFSLK